jgi:two-component system chemotaxis response regulator CheB
MKDVKIRVLVIDDSLFMRTLITDMLNSDPEIKVIDTAKNGEEAVNKIIKLKPGCVTLDLVMPGCDGLTTLEHIMGQCPTPVVIVSAHSKGDADITMECLNAGAVSFVLKPSGELSLDIDKVRLRLIEEVKAASKVDVAKIALPAGKGPKHRGRKPITLGKIVIIGASTGGPQALEKILFSLPVNFPFPIIIVQHLPTSFFTDSFAEHLNKTCDLEVRVAEDGEFIRPGRIYLAPAGYQLTLKPSSERNTDVVICLNKAEPDRLNPSIDITMESAAVVYHGNALGIILSGMGHDGCAGMKAIKTSGGKTVAQDESSLIFGMPKEVINAGYADKVLPAESIADAVMEWAS